MDKLNNFKKDAICPKCGSPILTEGDFWICSNVKNNKCSFKMPNTRNGKKLDIDMLIKYQNSKGHEKIKNLTVDTFNQKKKERMKRLNLNEHQLELFKKGTIISTCPICSSKLSQPYSDDLLKRGTIYLFNNNLECINHPHRCTFKMKASYGGVNFTTEEFAYMLDRGSSFKHTFTDEQTGEKKTGKVCFDLDSSTIKRKGLPTPQPKYLFFKDAKDFVEKYCSEKDGTGIYPTFIRTKINDRSRSIGYLFKEGILE